MKPHNIFFMPNFENREFTSVLHDVQNFITSEHSTLIAKDDDDSKAQIKRFILKYLQDKHITVEDMTSEELVEALYSEMKEFGFLTKYIYGKNVEEIDINSWRDIEIQYSNGLTEKLKEHFESPEHAVSMVRRMLHISGAVLDNSNPIVTGHISKSTRIAALKSPVVDDDVGVSASIRIVNPQNIKKEDFIKLGTATDDMLDFLAQCLRYGVSMCVAGATSSGKTTLAGWLLTTIPNHKRIFTIESGSREVDLVREENGRVVNSVIHTLARDSDDERQRISQIDLLDIALRFNPDLIFVGEMRDAEANAAQEAARTGVAVLTTIHATSCEASYRRMVSLCKRAVDMSDQTLLEYVQEAYPLAVYCKKLDNRERRITGIAECIIHPDGSREYSTLYQYVIDDNIVNDDGSIVITGHHEVVNEPSISLQKRLIENGMPFKMLARFLFAAEDAG